MKEPTALKDFNFPILLGDKKVSDSTYTISIIFNPYILFEGKILNISPDKFIGAGIYEIVRYQESAYMLRVAMDDNFYEWVTKTKEEADELLTKLFDRINLKYEK